MEQRYSETEFPVRHIGKGMMKQSKNIKVFVRNECANYSKGDEACVYGGSCKVMDGHRCEYFEKAVLGPPDYKHRLPGYDYGKLFAQYAELTKAKVGKVQQRRCGCGEPLQRRRRFCETCANRRAKDSNRARQKKHRLQFVST